MESGGEDALRATRLDASNDGSCRTGFDGLVGAQPRAGYHQPHLTALLRSLGLDVHYHRAKGNSVYYFNEVGDEIEVLDLVSGYGSLLLGHGHPS